MESEIGQMALVRTDYRKKDETFIQAAKRLGARGVFNRRHDLNKRMAKEWDQARKMKDFDEIKKRVVDDAKKNREYYEKRAGKIKQRCEERYLPREWRQLSSGEDEEEEQYRAERRVELARDGLYGDMICFDPVMG